MRGSLVIGEQKNRNLVILNFHSLMVFLIQSNCWLRIPVKKYRIKQGRTGRHFETSAANKKAYLIGVRDFLEFLLRFGIALTMNRQTHKPDKPSLGFRIGQWKVYVQWVRFESVSVEGTRPPCGGGEAPGP